VRRPEIVTGRVVDRVIPGIIKIIIQTAPSLVSRTRSEGASPCRGASGDGSLSVTVRMLDGRPPGWCGNQTARAQTKSYWVSRTKVTPALTVQACVVLNVESEEETQRSSRITDGWMAYASPETSPRNRVWGIFSRGAPMEGSRVGPAGLQRVSFHQQAKTSTRSIPWIAKNLGWGRRGAYRRVEVGRRERDSCAGEGTRQR